MDYQVTLGGYQTNYSIQGQMQQMQPVYQKPSVSEQMGFRKTRAS